MVFNSFSFLCFITVFFPLYWVVNQRADIKWRNVLIIMASYLFYGWWDVRFLSLIIISSATDYIIGLKIEQAKNTAYRKQLLLISILVNLGILGFFKYFNFFTDTLQEALSLFGISMNEMGLSIVLPVGISFYTFQTMSYTIDIYRKKMRATQDIWSFFAFVAFFPQLVAGPIERASRLLPQFFERKVYDTHQVSQGLRIALWGMFKKVVIADNVAQWSDAAFGLTEPSGFSTAIGALCFGIQIYADFSGYSDMAIGFAKTLGFELSTNFKTPYFASSFRNFWERWHISLSTWFRDYVYIPLGGNRASKGRKALNLMITFVLSGLWHGAHAKFLLWGFLHGGALWVERQLPWKRYKIYPFLVIPLVILFWIPFRAENNEQLMTLSASLLQWNWDDSLLQIATVFSEIKTYALLVVLLLFMGIEYRYRSNSFAHALQTWKPLLRWTVYYILVLLILALVNLNVKPSFIYFQF